MNIKDYLTYPALIEKADDGTYSVNIRGLPHSHTCANTYDEAKAMALELILDCAAFDAGRTLIAKGDDAKAEEVAINVPADAAIKMMLRNVMYLSHVNVHQLANKINEPDSKVRNTLNFRRATKLETLMLFFKELNAPLSITC